ncbi:hypothetical protein [Sulfobacillus harzensis]|uniref:Uncharacterized protein n=1 Tax=Sulfobacillus harzensis TaxID=2729629 RepID=A0A7Y0L115_9FIRM|nr:hypothetical protein [Sulfobacillus harzensis]NMP21323.1 hypothetical protein [Sulfobacillus harzensis]
MIRTPTIYWPILDHAGLRTLNWLLDHHPKDAVLSWYGQQGYAVRTLGDVWQLPEAVVEERVSRLREHWRRWLFGESAAALFVGPAGLLVGGPVLSVILLAWAVEMGWAYGLDMASPDRIDNLRRTIHQSLLRALGFPVGTHGTRSRWGRMIGTVLFWGFGPELKAADQVMAEIRAAFRAEWQDRHSPTNYGSSPRILCNSEHS